MTPYQVSSEVYGGFFYSGITLTQNLLDDTILYVHCELRYMCTYLLMGNKVESDSIF